MRVIFFILSILITSPIRGQEFFSVDSCLNYIASYKDKEFSTYLIKIEPRLRDEDKAEFYYYKALSYRFARDSEKQLKFLLIGFDFIKDTQYSLKSNYYDEFAISYKSINDGQLVKSLEFIDKSIGLKKRIKDSDIVKSYIIKGHIFSAAKYRSNNLDSALYYYYKAREINKKVARDFTLLRHINVSYLKQNKNIDSIEINLKAIIEYEKNSGRYQAASSSLISLASLYRRQEKFVLAKSILDTLLTHVNERGWKDQINSILENKIRLSVATNNHKEALAWKDSLYKRKYIDFQLNLDRVTKEHENEKLNLELSESKATTYKNRFWLSVLGGTIGTLLLFLFGLYKYYSLKRQKVEQELEATRMKAAFDATKAKMEGEQKERQSIASVLHDQVASLLTAADLHLNVAKKKNPSAQGITKAVGIIKDINTQVRDLSHQLVSPALIKFGLEAGLDSLVDRMHTEQTYITFVSKLGTKRYESSLETFLHQSASEFLQNILKHSSATQAHLVIEEVNGQLKLLVTDNGDNRNVPIKAATGLGLTHINARAAALGGQFTFTLNPIGAESLLVVPAVDVMVG